MIGRGPSLRLCTRAGENQISPRIVLIKRKQCRSFGFTTLSGLGGERKRPEERSGGGGRTRASGAQHKGAGRHLHVLYADKPRGAGGGPRRIEEGRGGLRRTGEDWGGPKRRRWRRRQRRREARARARSRFWVIAVAYRLRSPAFPLASSPAGHRAHASR
jgi:hypothetical protein